MGAHVSKKARGVDTRGGGGVGIQCLKAATSKSRGTGARSTGKGHPQDDDPNGCGAVVDIEDLPSAGPVLKSVALPNASDSAWLATLQKENDVAPLYRSQDIRAVHLELTTQCNAACPQCARNDHGGPENPLLADHHAELTIEDVKRLFPPDFVKQLKRIYLCGNFGDPAVARDCFEVLRYLRKCAGASGPQVGLFTNGGVRTPKWWAELGKVMQPKGRAFVRFAIDGNKDTNALYRQNVVWERLMANVEAFTRAGGNAEWDFIVFSHNEHQVEEMRELSEQLGFTKFNIKRTARFLDRDRGGLVDRTDVKDATGNVVRHLQPPAQKQWQNEAAVSDALRAIERHGSMDAYYDNTEISCKVAREGEVYISAQGLALPCCWLAGELLNMKIPEAKKQLLRLLWAMDGSKGPAIQNALAAKGGLQEVVDRPGGLFAQLVPAAMRQPSVACGRFKTCSMTCGKEVPAFTKQFDKSGNNLLPNKGQLVSSSPPAEQASTNKRVLLAPHVQVWYGSQTGNGEALAYLAASTMSVPVCVTGLEANPHLAKDALRQAIAVVLVVSTWGDGEPSDDAMPFFEWLESAAANGQVCLPPTAVFGLGSSFWPRFNAAARHASQLLHQGGVEELAPRGEANAAECPAEAPFTAWLRDKVIPKIHRLLPESMQGVVPADTSPALLLADSLEPRRLEGAIEVAVSSCKRLALGDAAAVYSEVELEVSDRLAYGTADAVGILPPNAPTVDSDDQAPSSSVVPARARWYTTSSCPSVTPGALRLTVREVVGGRCSPWLCRLKPGDSLRCLPPRKPSPLAAAVAKHPSAPMICIAAGAGIAPFIALLEQRKQQQDQQQRNSSSPPSNPWLLFMGCRQTPDALPHADRLEEFVRAGVLQELLVAESRPKVGQRLLVQDLLQQSAAKLKDHLDPQSGTRAVVLICGSAPMGAAARTTLGVVLSGVGCNVEELENSGRYVAELW